MGNGSAQVNGRMSHNGLWLRKGAPALWTAIDLCLIAIIAFFLTQTAYRSIIGAADANLQEYPRKTEAETADAGAADLRRNTRPVLLRNPFLPPSREQHPQPNSDGYKPPLKLWGTITGNDGLARAVIETEADKKQHLLKTGDWIDQARIMEIRQYSVVLAIEEKRHILTMQRWQTPGGQGIPSVPEQTISASPNRITVKRTQIDEAIQNINALMKQVRILPNFTDGKPDGLALSGVMTGSFFSSLGLQSGDILLGVDGKPIQSADDALKIYTGMKTANRLQLNIRRSGREESLEYTIE